MSPQKKIAFLITHGSEEMEAVITIDVLRRGGLHVDVVGVQTGGESVVRCSRGVKIQPDFVLNVANPGQDINPNKYDAVVLPGGQPGSDTFASDEQVLTILNTFFDAGKVVAAICAAPLALKAARLYEKRSLSITSYPATKSKLEDSFDYNDLDNVVVDGNLVTSKGPGTAVFFALKLVEILHSGEKAKEVKDALALPC
ncbi:Protein deglycase DJ-1zDJ-1 [Spiromyces aspiralis]|uniref:Protein deglycase DJ-1zDJ-1 n=1 Tax=Spiromyces aspiralis TaxID=68401 RepID=A0ACC1HS20_9FUNG|nr:Protein deglycase DJ-1zDJ-1 [Spiromyces aspiralis]